jgi:peptide/nickel transport system substrate-binding protein
MQRNFGLAITFLVVLSFLLLACAPTAPTTAPAAATVAPASATAAVVASTVAPAAATAAPKPSAAASGPTAAPFVKVKRGGEVIHAHTSLVNDFDNVTSTSLQAIQGGGWIYESLLNYELKDRAKGTFEIKPYLADSWDMSDPKKIVFKLHKGVKFSDGSEFNAEVAKWNLDRAVSHPKSAVRHLTDAIDTVDVIDTSTIRVNLKFASSTALVKLSNGVGGSGVYGTSMASKAAVEKGGPDVLRDKPVGTGPMVVSQWLPDDRIVFAKWGGYWQNGDDGQPLPYLDSFRVRYIPDVAVAYSELRAGSVHSLTNSTLGLKDVAAVKANPELVYDPQTWVNRLEFIPSMSMYTGPFKDNLKLRQAMLYALDRQAMANTIGFGHAKPAYYNQWGPGYLGYEESIPKYDFQLDKAKQLVVEAGYPNGLDVPLVTLNTSLDKTLGEMSQAMWAKIGVRVAIQSLDRTAGLAAFASGQSPFGMYHNQMYEDPDIFAPQALVCKAANNWFNWCNKSFDACIDEGGKIVGDDKKRHEVYKRCLTIFMEDAYIGSGYYVPRFFVYRSNVKGVDVHWADPDFRRVWLDK